MNHPTLVIGNTYYVINPAACSYVGRLVAIIDPFTVALEDASWVSDSGKRSVFIKTGKADGMEIEPVGFVAATRYQSIEVWDHPLFKEAI